MASRSFLDLFSFLFSLAALTFPYHAAASPLPALNSATVEHFLHGAIPAKGVGIRGEIQCYSLPYGGIGFLSHVLTYWTIACVVLGRRPLAPWDHIEYKAWNAAMGLGSLLLTVGLSAFTIVLCRDTWEFVLLAVWKLTMSFTLGCVTVHRSVLVQPGEKANGAPMAVSKKPGLWLLIYGCGVVAGLTGLLPLVVQSWDIHRVRIISEAFGGTVFVVLSAFVTPFLIWCVFALCCCCLGIPAFVGTMVAGAVAMAGVFVSAIGVLSALYSDWVLGAMVDNLIGEPGSMDIRVLYWTYFVAKRLPLLSF